MCVRIFACWTLLRYLHSTCILTQTHIYPFKLWVKSHLPFASIIRGFNVYGSVHRKYIPIYKVVQIWPGLIYTRLHTNQSRSYLNHLVYLTRCNVTQFIHMWKLLNTFRVVLPPIIWNVYNCIYSIWYLSHRYCYLALSWKSWNWFECAVGGVIATV
jgi:hypothetical protein